MNTSIATNSPAFTMNPLQPKWDYGRASFDIRHLAVINAIYDLPFGRNNASGIHPFLNRLTGGWQVSGIETLQTGLPFTPQMSFNPANDGDSRNPIRPSWNPAFTGRLVLGGPNRYFDPNAFVALPMDLRQRRTQHIARIGLASWIWRSRKDSRCRSASARKSERISLTCSTTRTSIPQHDCIYLRGGGPSPTAGVITATSTSSRQIQLD